MLLIQPLWTISQHIFFSIIGILGIGFLIGFHELGHFLFCKVFKIRTPSFSIGFGPRLFTKKFGETEFALSAIPLGGYVEIAGSAEMAQGEQKEAHSTDQYSFATKPYYQKLVVMFGGILFNMLFAYVVVVGLFMSGLPKSRLLYPLNAIPTIQTIEPSSAAAQYNLQVNDIIIRVQENPIANVSDLVTFIQAHPNQSINITIARNGEQITLPITVGSRQVGTKTVGVLGVEFVMNEIPARSFIASIKEGVRLTNDFIARTFKGYISIFAKRDISQVEGPLAIFAITIKGAAEGLKILLLFLAIISINLAVLNLIPLPILDGGQILFCTIEAIMGRQLPTRVKEYIHIASWILILLLIVYVSIKDIMRIGYPYLQAVLHRFGFN